MKLKIAVILFFVINLAIIVGFWAWISGGLMFTGKLGLAISWGRLTGLLAVYFVLWQVLLVSRTSFLEKAFGLDKLFFWHHLNGFLSLFFIILHPILLAIGYGLKTNRNLIEQLIGFWSWEEMPLAFLSVLAFLVVVVISVRIIKKKYRYETWYFVHLLVYLAIFWAFEHQLEAGKDLQNSLFAFYWRALYLVFFGYLIYYRFFKPLFNFYHHRFTVTKIISENDQIVSVYIGGQNLSKLNIQAGQFFLLRFLNKYAWQSHPFSISNFPLDKELRFTIKNLGDFTKDLLNKIKVGDKVILEGPYGVFTAARSQSKKLALIAGGIGITPIQAIINSLTTTKSDLILLWANRRQTDIIFSDEINLSLKNNPHLKVHHILSDESNFTGECGFIDEEKVKRLIPDYLERDFYFCGPPLMRRQVITCLKRLGVKTASIHWEKFTF